ncbi:MAG: succinylglutamate-semialdehyde dehydrogenase [Pseudomonadota bacterium]
MDDQLFIQGRWRDGRGPVLQSREPAGGAVIFEGASATPDDVDNAVDAARRALDGWSRAPLEDRVAVLERYRDIVLRDAEKLARLIARETGKPLWETKTEAAAVAGKVDISVRAYKERTGVKESVAGPTRAVLRHRPHGVMAVLGPFNFPAHLPNGHIVPALIAGNAVVFKPSELAPGPGAFLVAAMAEAGVPEGVVNLVHGARETGEALAGHDGVDGLLFTGGAATGDALRQAYAARPEKILALELGGNNPLIWWDTEAIDAAAFATVQSAFLTAGQRCTCARRLIIPDGAAGERAVDALLALVDRLIVDEPLADPQPFHGPVITPGAAQGLAAAFAAREAAGGAVLRRLRVRDEGGAFVTPGVIDMTGVADVPDEEHFGPMLQIFRVADFDSAITHANATRFGLSAGLLSDDQDRWDDFLARSRAGIVNWNRQTTGASSAAPFGGIGASGNHRPSAYYAADYCAYPVASMEGDALLDAPADAPGLRA